MRLNRRTLMMLGGSLLIIIAVLVVQQPLQNMILTSTPTPMSQLLLPSNLAKQATQLIVRQLENYTQIDKTDGVWQVTDATAIDESRETHDEFVSGLLELMSGFEYDSAFESDDLSQFGLADSTVKIEIRTDVETFILSIGRSNPDGDGVYVRLNDESMIYLMPTVFEFANMIRLATEPPYRQFVAEATAEVSDNLLFPDIFGYQVAEFMIRDERDGAFIRYKQGELGTWLVEGTVVNESREMNHVQAAIHVSQFLLLEVEAIDQSVRDSATDGAILTVSMIIDEDRAYNMSVIAVDELGYIGVLNDGNTSQAYQLPFESVIQFANIVRQPPYAEE